MQTIHPPTGHADSGRTTTRRPGARLLRQVSNNSLSVIASLAYLALGWLWITLSDQIGELLFSSPDQLTRFQTYKGVGFVLVTAALIYWMLRQARTTALAAPTAGADPAGPGKHWPLRLMLSLLAMSTALPLAGLVGFALYRESVHEINKANHLVQDQAEATASATEGFMKEHAHMAEMLALRNQVRELDPARCDTVLLDLLASRPALADIVTTDASGEVVCSARRAAGRTALQPMSLPGTWHDENLTAGSPQSEPGTSRWVMPLSRPLPLRDGAYGSVQLFVYLTALQPLVAGPLPVGGVAALYDADGYSLARSIEPATHVGRKVDDQGLLDRVRRTRSGEGIAVGPDHVERLYAYRPVADTPWFAVTGVPTQAMYAQARLLALQYGLAALLILGVSAWLVMRISRGISDPMAALVRTALRVGSGQFDERATESGPREVAEVAHGFNFMLDRIPVIEKGLQESEERHRSLVELSPDGIVVQCNGVVTYANAGFRRMMGLDSDAPVAGMRLVDMAPVEWQQCMRDRMDRLQAGPDIASPMELTLRRADGTPVDIEQACCSTEQDGRIVVQTHMRDVTARNQARRALEQANQTLEQRISERTAELRSANKALGAFAYTVAHDLQGPAQRMSGYAQALTRAVSDGDTERLAHFASRIAHNAHIMDGIINGLLKLSQAGNGGLAWRQVDMQQLVSTVLSDLEAPADLVSVGALPVVPADPATIRQVWANLISNAIKYSARQSTPHVHIACSAGARDFVFSVRDNGVGFDPADAAQLFGVFQRLPGSEDYSGSGVGLAIVRRIVERHGGQVWAEARPGEGATFYFSLPRSRPEEA